MFGILLLIIHLVLPVSAESGVDLHWLWDDRCAECHGHSADFSRKFLRVSEGELQGRHHVDDLRRFLANHYLAPSLVDDIQAMMLAQVQQPARFKNECAACHQNAASFVREKLSLKNGQLIILDSGVSVEEFLGRHRRLNENDISFFVSQLTRVAGELGLSGIYPGSGSNP